jgi:hypothetical protein
MIVKRMALALMVSKAARIIPSLVTSKGPKTPMTSPGVEKENGSINHMKRIKVFTTKRRFKRPMMGFAEVIVIKMEKSKARADPSRELKEAVKKAKIRAPISLALGQVLLKLKLL